MNRYRIFRRITSDWERPLLVAVIATGNVFLFANLPNLDRVCFIIFLFLIVRAAPKVVEVIRDQIRARKNINWDVDIPEALSIANRMGVDLNIQSPFGLVADLFTAMAKPKGKDNQIIIGQPLVEQLGKESVIAIIAHELAHIKDNNARIRRIFFGGICLFFLLLLYIIILRLPYALTYSLLITMVTWVSTGLIVLSVLQWRCEYNADRVASEYVGADTMKTALNGFTLFVNKDEVSLTHPSISKRISNLT